MSASDEAMMRLCEVMLAEFGAGDQFQLDLGELVGKARRLHSARMRDRRAADLLPTHGYKAAAEALGVCPATVYNMAERAAILSKQTEAA